jgi:hypothetical protein
MAKFLSDSAWYFYIFWLPKYLGDVRHLNIAQIGYYAWIPYVGAGTGLTNPLISIRFDLAPICGRPVDPGCHRGAGLDHGQGGAVRGDSRLHRRAIWA